MKPFYVIACFLLITELHASCREYFGVCQADWILNLPNSVKDKPLNQIKLLGSHDTAAYRLDLNTTTSMEKTKMINWFIQPAVENSVVKKIVEQLILTQTQNLFQQLEQGIRVFDLRLTYNQQLQEFFLSHSFSTIRLTDALTQIQNFMNQHLGEFLIIQIQDDAEHIHATTPYNDQAIRLIQSMLGSWLVPTSQSFSLMTLNELLNSNQRILFSFMSSLMYRYPNIWPTQIIKTYWPNGQSVHESLNAIDHYTPNLRLASNDFLNLVFFTVTPDQNVLVANVLSDFLDCELPISTLEWATKINQASMSYLSKNQSNLMGLNIISVDNPSDDYVQQIISWNQ